MLGSDSQWEGKGTELSSLLPEPFRRNQGFQLSVPFHFEGYPEGETEVWAGSSGFQDEEGDSRLFGYGLP